MMYKLVEIKSKMRMQKKWCHLNYKSFNLIFVYYLGNQNFDLLFYETKVVISTETYWVLTITQLL